MTSEHDWWPCPQMTIRENPRFMNLVRRDNPSDVARGRQCHFTGERLHAPIFREDVEVLIPRAGIKQHNSVAALQEFAVQELLVGSQRSSSFRAGEDALN